MTLGLLIFGMMLCKAHLEMNIVQFPSVTVSQKIVFFFLQVMDQYSTCLVSVTTVK